MLSNPCKPFRNIHNTPAASDARGSAGLLAAALLLAGTLSVQAQEFGSHNLPAELSDAGTKVLGVMNKAPSTNRALGYSEGPVGDAEGNLYFTEDNAGAGNIWKVTAAGVASNFYNGPGMPNGLEFDNQGKLFSAEKGGVAQYDKSGSTTRTMIPMNPGLNQNYRVNDLTIASNGWMFFTNHANGHQFFFRDATGKVTTYEQGSAVGVNTPNGIEYIEEKKMLLVTGDGAKKVFRFDVKEDGTVSNRTEFASINEPDGLTLDEKGNIYVASYAEGAVHVFDTAGKLLGKITVNGNSTPAGNTSNCVFGGVDGKTLFITGDLGAFKLQMKVAGRKRPGTVGVSRPRYSLAPLSRAGRTGASGYTLSGRKLETRAPAALMIVTSPLSR
jgi:gluconolactonase